MTGTFDSCCVCSVPSVTSCFRCFRLCSSGISVCIYSFRVRPVRLSAFLPFRTRTFSHGTSRRDHRHADRCGDLVVTVVDSFGLCGFLRHDGAPPARRLVESRPVHRPPRFSPAHSHVSCAEEEKSTEATTIQRGTAAKRHVRCRMENVQNEGLLQRLPQRIFCRDTPPPASPPRPFAR